MTDQMPLPDVVKESGLTFVKGLCNSSRGRRLLAAGALAVRTNAPRIGRFGAWFGLQLATERAMQLVTKKDDPLNTQISFGAAGALVSMRRGPRAAALSALKGAALGGLGEIALDGLRRW